ncbi:MAG: dimethyl sulfoxide reductase anchor subunit [Eggerthellaceae bacterium]|nr:dimethyl sulfoxide reductase anchor subunit [Eggerthellaceae bacterium]
MEIQWPLVFFSTLAGCGGITLAFVGFSEIVNKGRKANFVATIIALILIVVGGCFSVLHLAQRSNIFAAATNVFSFSAISLELIFLGLTVIVGIVYLILDRANSRIAARVLAIIGLVFGLCLAFVTGNGYVMEAQPNWNTITLPLAYLGTDLAAGALVYTAVCSIRKVDDADIKFFSASSAICALLSILFVFAYNIAIGFTGNPALFWAGCVVGAGILPLAASILGVLKVPGKMGYLIAGAIIALVGSACLRIMMFMLGTGWLNLFSDAAQGLLL